MSSISWPTTGRLSAALQQDEHLQWNVEVNTWRNGRATTRVIPGWTWLCDVYIPDDTVAHLAERRQLEALLVQLRGGGVRLNLWNLLTPLPLGTLQSGTPQVASAMSAGATSVALKNCSGTLLRGDRIQFGTTGQRVMVVADATPSAGNMTVIFEPEARAAASVDSVITYLRPYTSYILAKPELVLPYRSNVLPGFGISLIEGWE